jgi:hypothetical protein
MSRPDRFFTKSMLAAVILITPLATSVQAACGGHGGHGGPPSFEDFDRDGDGFVSEEEFLTLRAQRMAEKKQEGRPMRGASTAPPFSDVDTNGDGRLDRDEFDVGREAHMKMMHEQGMGHHHGKHHGKGMKMPTFADLDLNGDGCIDAEEFGKHQAEMHGKSE